MAQSTSYKNKKPLLLQGFKNLSEPEGIRTPDRLLRREMLYPAELLARCVVLVGVAGFEPATSCSQSRRDDRATLHPEWTTFCFCKTMRKYISILLTPKGIIG